MLALRRAAVPLLRRAAPALAPRATPPARRFGEAATKVLHHDPSGPAPDPGAGGSFAVVRLGGTQYKARRRRRHETGRGDAAG